MQTSGRQKQFMTLAEVAALWEVSKGTVVRWRDAGLIPSVKLPGGKQVYPADAIHADHAARCGTSRNGQVLVKGE